jgi:hypothetical protein
MLFPSLFSILFEIAFTFLTGWGILQYFQQNQILNPIVIRVLIILAIGLVAGFISRLLFRKRHIFWKLVISLISVGLSLFVLDKVFPTNYDLVFIDRKPWTQPVGIDILQIGLGYVMSMLALLIGRRRIRQRKIEPRPRAVVKTKVKKKIEKQKKLIIGRLNKNGRNKKVIKKVVKKTDKKQIHSRRLLPGYRISSLVTAKPRRTRRKDVRLLGETEHRCPYCFELVKKNDARGVVICPDCKTWHHKDCWDITGSCQVAHRNDL